MSNSKEYKAIKNFFHNKQKLTKQEIKELLREIIQEYLRDNLAREMQYNVWIEKLLTRHIETHMHEMKTLIAAKLANQYNIYVQKKNNSCKFERAEHTQVKQIIYDILNKNEYPLCTYDLIKKVQDRLVIDELELKAILLEMFQLNEIKLEKFGITLVKK